MLSITAAQLLENKNVLLNGNFDPLCPFLYFCGKSVVAVIMIDSGKKRNSLVGVEVQSPYVIERRSNIAGCAVEVPCSI